MLRNFSLLFAGLLIIMLVACNNSPQDQGSQPETREALSEITINDEAKKPKESYSFLTAGKWYVQFTDVIRRPEARDTFKGQWFDFHKDYTYERGISEEKVLTGSYDFDNDKKLLTFRPDNPKLEPISEWHVMTASDMMVLAGTSLYGNNHIQIKLEKELPPSDETKESE